MGQFKPMVKMMTTEPTVELKLKKGGHVNRKHEGKEHHGHKAMHHMMDGGVMGALAGAPGMAAPVMGNPRAASGGDASSTHGGPNGSPTNDRSPDDEKGWQSSSPC